MCQIGPPGPDNQDALVIWTEGGGETQMANKANKTQAQTNQMKPNTSTDKSNQMEAVHLDVPLLL
jgi:hypothetical protein